MTYFLESLESIDFGKLVMNFTRVSKKEPWQTPLHLAFFPKIFESWFFTLDLFSTTQEFWQTALTKTENNIDKNRKCKIPTKTISDSKTHFQQRKSQKPQSTFTSALFIASQLCRQKNPNAATNVAESEFLKENCHKQVVKLPSFGSQEHYVIWKQSGSWFLW